MPHELSVRFLTDLGAEVHVPVEIDTLTPPAVEAAVFATLRAYGHRGWRPGPLPPGGYAFPLANEADFDWSLIGAYRTTRERDGETLDGVYYAGDFYTRRALDPTKKIKHPAVKYSRGARPTDPPEIREADGEIQYVTLAMFRGSGRKRDAYTVPANTPATASRTRRTTSARNAPAEQAPPVAPAQSAPAAEPMPAPAVDDSAPVATATAVDIDALTDSPAMREALIAYIRSAGPDVNDQTATIVRRGQRHPLKPFVNGHWTEIKSDFRLLKAVAAAVQRETGKQPDLPAAV